MGVVHLPRLCYSAEMCFESPNQILIQILVYVHHLKEEMADELSKIVFSLGEHVIYEFVFQLLILGFIKDFGLQ